VNAGKTTRFLGEGRVEKVNEYKAPIPSFRGLLKNSNVAVKTASSI
jgi:hypothetical protein